MRIAHISQIQVFVTDHLPSERLRAICAEHSVQVIEKMADENRGRNRCFPRTQYAEGPRSCKPRAEVERRVVAGGIVVVEKFEGIAPGPAKINGERLASDRIANHAVGHSPLGVTVAVAPVGERDPAKIAFSPRIKVGRSQY